MSDPVYDLIYSYAIARLSLPETRDAMMAEGRALIENYEALPPTCRNPVPIILHCPMCSTRHLDVGEFATKPHHTHACQNCGHCWRPAVVPTVGVQFLPGFKNEEAKP